MTNYRYQPNIIDTFRRLSKTVGISILVCSMVSFSYAFAEELYQYDALGRLISVTQEDGSVITYEYDPAGNRKKTSVAGTGVSDQDPHGASSIVVVPLNGFTMIVID